MAKLNLVLVLTVFGLVGSSNGQADLGPKPTAHFSIALEDGVQLKDASLLQCEAVDCSDARPLEAFGPQGFSCAQTECAARAYGFSPYLQLRLTLSDGRILTSRAFEKTAFDATYSVTVIGDEVKIK